MSSRQIENDWLIFEVLTRLPVKSLLRFKTVCKSWCYLVQKDENFIDLHLLNRSRLRRLFIVNPVPRTPERWKELNDYYDGMDYWDKGHDTDSSITADLILFQHNNEGDTSATNVVAVDTVREVDSTDYNIMSNPVNGLICLIDKHHKYAVRICNISTRELSPWVESSLLSEEKEGRRMKDYGYAVPSYQLGFDPSTNEHKLVCVWEVYSKDRRKRHLICEVLTIGRQGINGNDRWRRIEEVPDVRTTEDSVHVNGVIYWMGTYSNNGFGEPVYIVAFDVGRENFRTITVPDFFFDSHHRGNDLETECNPLDGSSYFTDDAQRFNLLEVSGLLAMLVRVNNCLFKIYTYEDGDYKLEEMNRIPTGSSISFSSNNSERWSEVTSFTLPFNLGLIRSPSSKEELECGVRFCKFVGSDNEIILTSSEGQNCGKEVRKKKCVSFYSYNWKKGRWREFEVRGNPLSFPHLCTECFVVTFSESLLPVNDDKALF